MSPSSFTLAISASDKTVELTVIDSRQRRVASATGAIQAELAAGLYKIHARLGPSVVEQFVSLDKDRTVDISPKDFSFPTPVPLENTATVHEYHEDAAVIGSQMPPVQVGQGSTLFFLARDWSADESAHDNPMAGLTLHDIDGKQLADLDSGASIDGTDPKDKRDASAANRVSVDPGAYRLRLTLADGSMLERSLIASPGWQTQIFLLMQNYGTDRRADLAGGAIVMGRSGVRFDPLGRGERAAVLARYALVHRRPIADAVYRELYELKFQDPILGLLAAHLLLRDDPENPVREEVMANLREMLGQTHPDVQALDLHDPGSGATERALVAPPMLRASWDEATAASVGSPTVLPSIPLFADVENALLPSRPWLTWRVEEELSTFAVLPAAVASNHKLRALKAFVDAYGREEPARRSRSGHFGLQEMIVNETTARAAPLSRELDVATKIELTRALGISGSRLDVMLNEVQSEKPFELFATAAKPEEPEPSASAP